MSFVREWRDRHAARERLAGSEYGPSALESTNRLITMLAAVDGIPELWALTGDSGICGSELGQAGASVTLRNSEYRFRLLPVEEPAADGSAIIDFTCAYLPPCAFLGPVRLPAAVAGQPGLDADPGWGARRGARRLRGCIRLLDALAP